MHSNFNLIKQIAEWNFYSPDNSKCEVVILVINASVVNVIYLMMVHLTIRLSPMVFLLMPRPCWCSSPTCLVNVGRLTNIYGGAVITPTAGKIDINRCDESYPNVFQSDFLLRYLRDPGSSAGMTAS